MRDELYTTKIYSLYAVKYTQLLKSIDTFWANKEKMTPSDWFKLK